GVSTSSFQTEGGLDGPGEPATNWRHWAEIGKVEPIDAACDLWRRYDEVADRVKAMGLDLFRASVEWARLAPSGERFDRRAVEGYAGRFAALRLAGVEPVVTLMHFTHPEWLDVDLWLDPRAPEVFRWYAGTFAEQLGDAMARRGQAPL